MFMRLLLGVCSLGTAKEELTCCKSGEERESQQDSPFAVASGIARCLDCSGTQAVEKGRCDERKERSLNCGMHVERPSVQRPRKSALVTRRHAVTEAKHQ